MTSALAATNELSPSDLAEELYRFLCEIDPGAWRDETVAAARDALEKLRARGDALVSAWEEPGAITLPAVGVQEVVERLVRAMPDPVTMGASRGEWADLRDRLTPLHDALARALRDEGARVAHLRPTNYVRNLFHAGHAVFVVGLFEIVLTPSIVVWVAAGAAAFAWTLEGTRRLSERWNRVLMWVFGPVAHAHEAHRVNSATWFASALLVLAITAPDRAGMLGLLALGFGDPMAAVVGRRWGRRRLWRNRSLEGTAAFAVATCLVGLVYLGLVAPEMTWGAALLLAGAAGVVGALVELFTVRLDDNLTIPVLTAWALLGLQALV